MKSKTVTVKNQYGIHARVAMDIVNKCKNYQSEIKFCKDCSSADGCSILEILMLEGTKDSVITITASGEDEDMAIKELDLYFSNGAGI